MKKKLLELPAEELLELIGAGNHKPGSGSAAALNALLSCKLLLTVIQLTIDERRRNRYKEYTEECTRIFDDINLRIAPNLEELFDEDSVQFDLAIRKRKERDSEENQYLKNKLDSEAQEALKLSTELPLRIAELSLELAHYSIFLFDNAFQSARGDSGVALSSALSSIYGCLSIVSLNLHTFPKNGWTVSIKKHKAEIRMQYEKLHTDKIARLDFLDEEADKKNNYLANLQMIKTSLYGKSKIHTLDIENLARKIQNFLWVNKKIIWKNKVPDSPLSIIDPVKVIRLLKYEFKEVPSLGVNENNDEIAGVIDNENSIILISKMYPTETINFTTAHELGHALLHDKLTIHRDRPLDKPEFTTLRPTEEKQADKFAACFLMPGKQLKIIFRDNFKTSQLKINQDVAFGLGFRSVRELTEKTSDLRSLTRLIASTNFFHTAQFQSLAEIFGVSIEAMAIRLEELDLVRL